MSYESDQGDAIRKLIDTARAADNEAYALKKINEALQVRLNVAEKEMKSVQEFISDTFGNEHIFFSKKFKYEVRSSRGDVSVFKENKKK